MARIYFAGLGCAKNQVDGEWMLGAAQAKGHEIVDAPERADVLVVNTCAFIDAAREESVDAILELAAKKGAGRRLVVSGCLAERYREELLEQIPEIDALVGTGALDRLSDAVEARDRAMFLAGRHQLPSASMPRRLVAGDGSAYLKVSDGCDHECSFCSIPSFRGRHESRPLADLVEEAEALVARGVVELNLVAQDLSAFGRDRAGGGGLAALLRRLGAVEGLVRVRCLYFYPTTLDDEVLAAMAETENVCRYVDLPLQHADRGVLKAMRRGGDGPQYLALLARIRDRLAGAAVRSSFIVGFPGESEAAFEALCEFVKSARFDRIAVFRYSSEPGTAAAGLPGQVSREVAERRRDVLLSLQESVCESALARYVGTTREVLVCGRDENGQWFGRTREQAPEIDGITLLGAAPALPAGRCIRARITASDAYDLYGEPLLENASPGVCLRD